MDSPIALQIKLIEMEFPLVSLTVDNHVKNGYAIEEIVYTSSLKKDNRKVIVYMGRKTGGVQIQQYKFRNKTENIIIKPWSPGRKNKST